MSDYTSSSRPEQQAPAPESEPSEIFLDRGASIPDHYNSQRFRALVRDPHNLHVYWAIDSPPEGAEGWVLEVTSHASGRATSVNLPLVARRASLALPTLSGGTASLRARRDDQPAEVLMTLQYGPAPNPVEALGPGAELQERWLELSAQDFAAGAPPRIVSGPTLGRVLIEHDDVHSPAAGGGSLDLPSSHSV